MKISLVTTCMNRLEHLMQTFPKNYQDALNDNVNFEFVIVDYNSKDNLADYIEKQAETRNRIFYVKEFKAQVYSMGHSRNIGFKVATGDVVVQVDCDNFIKPGFCKRCLEIAESTPGPVVMHRANHRLMGRLGFRKKEFIDLLGGYDETFEGYGADDRDIFERAKALGFTPVVYGGELSQFERITHGKSISTDNMAIKSRREGERRNKAILEESLRLKRYKANVGKAWGTGFTFCKNFQTEI